MDEMFELQYDNPEIHRLLKIYRRTSRNRIKNKLFNRIFAFCLEEKGVILLKDSGIVIMKYNIYRDLLQDQLLLENIINMPEKNDVTLLP